MSQLFANWYDFLMSPFEKKKFKIIRKDLLSKATGKVLEIGAGTGVNFPLYKKAEAVVAIEPSLHMIEQARLKKKHSSIPIEIVQASAERLPFSDHSFDSVVATLVFCTIPNPEKAIQEIIRVCKPGGQILFFEHVKMNNRLLARLQDWLTPAWKKIADGCSLNRDTQGLIRAHQLSITRVENHYKGLFVIVEARNRK